MTSRRQAVTVRTRSVPMCGSVCINVRVWRRPCGLSLAFTVVVRETPQRRLEVGRRLLLDLVRERVDLEPVQPGTDKCSMFTH